MKILYQTSTNSVRQKTQALVQQWWKQIGVEAELKNVDAAVYFGGDPASPDTLGKFYADVQMFTNGPESLDPADLPGRLAVRRSTARATSPRPRTAGTPTTPNAGAALSTMPSSPSCRLRLTRPSVPAWPSNSTTCWRRTMSTSR